MQLNAERAALSLAQGKSGTCGILRKEDGSFEFLGFGLRRPVLMLRICIGEDILTEKTCEFSLIMRKGKPDRPAWAVLTDHDWTTLLVSTHTDRTLSCIALIDGGTSFDKDGSRKPAIPLSLKAHFDAKYSGLMVVCEDLDFVNLISMECAMLGVPKYRNAKLEGGNSLEPKTRYFETA